MKNFQSQIKTFTTKIKNLNPENAAHKNQALLLEEEMFQEAQKITSWIQDCELGRVDEAMNQAVTELISLTKLTSQLIFKMKI